MHTVSKEFEFEASHHLDPALLGPTHKCCRMHGHSYRVRVYCSAQELDARGFVIDYAEISAAVDPVVAQLDHRFLNQALPFHTTAENLAHWFFYTLKETLPSVSRIDVHETRKTVCTYTP